MRGYKKVMNDKQIDYKKKKKLYETLGAKSFKKVVMKVERVRWKITKRFFPNYLSYYEKSRRKELGKELAKASSDKERKVLENRYRYQILTARREFNYEENVNYHMNMARPNETIEWLKWNKKVHKDNLKVNFMIAAISSGFALSGIGTGIALAIIGLEALSATINWQCINLQDYNLCRLELHKEALKRKEQRRQEANAIKYGETSQVIQKAFDNTKEVSKIPTPQEIVEQINNKEQLRQMQEWIASIKSAHIAKTETTEIGRRTKK